MYATNTLQNILPLPDTGASGIAAIRGIVVLVLIITITIPAVYRFG